MRGLEAQTIRANDAFVERLELALGCSVGDTEKLLEVDAFTWFKSAAEFSRLRLAPQQARIILRRLVEEYPDSPYLYYLEGSSFAANSEWQPALSALQNTLERLPDNHPLAARVRCELAAIALFLNRKSQYDRLNRTLLDTDLASHDASVAWPIARVCLEGSGWDEQHYHQAVQLVEALDATQLSQKEMPHLVATRLLGHYRLGRFAEMEELAEWLWNNRDFYDNYLAVSRQHFQRLWTSHSGQLQRAQNAMNFLGWLNALQPQLGPRVTVPHASWVDWLHMQLITRLANDDDAAKLQD